MSTLKCVACRKPLENISTAFGSDAHQPYDGLAFHTYGHYGSTYFDPMDGETYLELSICDECVKRADEEGLVRHGVYTAKDRQDAADRRAALQALDEFFEQGEKTLDKDGIDEHPVGILGGGER